MAADNKSLGRFILDGIPPAPRGVPQIEVTFDINADGILKVSAKDKATGREQAMQIIPSSGLRDEEIERMVTDAEQHASDDRERKAAVEAQNTADSAIYSAEKFLREQSDNLPEANKKAIQSQIDTVRSVLGGKTETIRTEVEKLQSVMQEAGAAMYQQQGGPAGAGPAAGSDGGPAGSDEDVIEGEFSDA
jgi:molecular chaperone DnaK